MHELPWLKPDFNLATVLASAEGDPYRHALERALRDAARRIDLRRQLLRDRTNAAKLARLSHACAVAEDVIRATHDAIRT